MSAKDLIVDYYRRDLDAAEEEALGRLLESSPAEAQRFAALAAEDYRRFGLPEPGSDGQSKGPWFAGALLVGGLAVWASWPGTPSPRPVLAMQEDSGSFRLAERSATVAMDQPEIRVPRPVPGLLRVGTLGPQGPFEISVGRGRIGEGTVRDRMGRWVADLQRLDATRLRWDGHVDGRLAPSGAYQLWVDVDGIELKQWVEIEVR